MNPRNIFAILEIEPTDDKQAIKKAYAKLVKKYHPEEYPEKWKEIHDAYEAAIALIEWHGQDSLTFSVTDNAQMADSAAKEPRPVLKVEKTEIPWKPPEESDELDSLFDNINILSKEQQAQDKEAYEKELQEVLHAFEKITDKKKLDRKEWEDFFSKKARLPYLCNRDFLKMLGECFSDRKIDAGMYQFLLEQLEVIKTYCTDGNNVPQTISALDPVKYAEIKISGAYSRGKIGILPSKIRAVGGVCKKILIAILVIDIIIIRLNIGHTGQSQKETEIPGVSERAEREMTVNIFDEDGKVLARSNVPGLPDMLQIGDSKETMLEVFGEPAEISTNPEKPDREEAIYLPGEGNIRLVVVLDKEIVTNIYAEYVTENR